LPSTWDKADALGRARDTVALREAAKYDTAQAQLEAIERYHCAQTGEPYDDEPQQPPSAEEPPTPQPEQEVLDGFDSVMRMATELSKKDLPIIDQFVTYIAGLRFTNTQQEMLIAEAAKRTGARVPALRADLKASKKLARAYQAPRLPAGDPWKADLILDDEGIYPRPVMANVAVVAEKHPHCGLVFGINDFTSYVTLMAPPPWVVRPGFEPRPITDDDVLDATVWIQQNTGVLAPSHIVLDGIRAAANKAHFHPVKEYLDSLDWDGVERIAGLFTDYYGVAADAGLSEKEHPDRLAYYHAIGARFLIGAVARICEPGCKLDTMPNLLGAQGAGKSSSLRILFGDQWFSDEISELGSKDAAMQAAGIWCIEIGELAAVRKATVERVKAWLSRQVDRFRPPYGRAIKEQLRQCVAVGTTNDDSFLVDETGNRRSWAVRCGAIDLVALKRDRDQLWAEATERYHAGRLAADMVADGSEHPDDLRAEANGRWWLHEPDLVRIAADIQSEFMEQDPWHDTVMNFIDDKDSVTIDQVLGIDAIGLRVQDREQKHYNRVAGILTMLSWNRKQQQKDGKRTWRYFPPPEVHQ
jgi:putative DNA primase/helicase